MSIQFSCASIHSHLIWLAVSSSGLGGNSTDNEDFKPQKPPPFYQPWRFGLSCNFFDETTVDSPPQLLAFPSRISAMVLSNVIHLSMWFYNMLLKVIGCSYDNWSQAVTKDLLPGLEGSAFKDSFDKDNPTKQAIRTTQATRSRRLKLLSTMLLFTQTATSTSVMELSSSKQLQQCVRKCRSSVDGSVNLSNITNKEALCALKMQWQTNTQTFQSLTAEVKGALTGIVDTGATLCAVPDENLCKPGSIHTLPEPRMLDGISGGLMIKRMGLLEAECVDLKGRLQVIEVPTIVHPELPGIILSPQALMGNIALNKVKDHFRIYHDHMELHMGSEHLLDIPYNDSFLPSMTFFKKGTADASLKAFNSVLHSSNKNLSPLKKIWLHMHNCAGHLSFKHVQQLAAGGYFGKAGLALSQVKLSDAPLCEACKYGKQVRTPDGVNSHTRKPEKVGALTEGKLVPGQTIFMDQLESRLKGRLLHTAGREPEHDKFCGSTLFCDAASHYIHVEHQVTLNSSDTINAKTSFERTLLEMGVSVDGYHTDNGVFKSHAFTRELAQNYQKIRFSGVGAKWQNGVAENAIKIVVSKARTMMIHAQLMWPEAKDESLWPLAVSHAAYLYNHTPNEHSGVAPIEVMSGSVNDGRALMNAKPWGCPAYVLEPKLTSAGGKIPKWKPRSRRGQYVGISPVHAETVSLIRNLNTGYISPQFHIVFDDKFETVYADEDEPPPAWDDMCIFQRFETVFDENVTPPPLAEEWLTPEEAAQQRAKRQIQRNKFRPSKPEPDPDFEPATRRPPADPPPTVVPRSPPSPEPPPKPREQPPQTREQPTASNLKNWDRKPPLNSPKVVERRYPARQRQPTVKEYEPAWKGKSYQKPNRHFAMLAAALAMTNVVNTTPPTAHMLQAQAIGFDPHTGIQECTRPDSLASALAIDMPRIMKAKKSKDPDLPSLRESLTGPHAEEFWKAMDKEIASLEGKGTWEVVDRKDVPANVKVIPGTWCQRIKRHPDGRLNKFKSRWCFRGDLERATYEGNPYSPLVGWPTIRASLLLAASKGWKSRQVDFTLAFCQSPQERPVYMELPQYYRPKSIGDRDVVLRLKKSIYGQMDSPKLFYNHLCKGMNKLGFLPSDSDPCLFIHKTKPIMVLNYCDDQIWLSPDNKLIEEHVDKLKGLGYDLTIEPEGDMFGFLGIEFKQIGKTIELTQKGLIEKVINYTGLKDCKPQPTPSNTAPLGSHKHDDPFDEEWSYPAAVGMLLYIASNTRPDIQFAVHQVARFTHCPKRAHGSAVKRIVRYLAGTSKDGIKFVPDLKAGLDCYVDADFAGLWGHEDEQDPVCVKSRTGFTLTLFGCPVIWSSKLQELQVLSTVAAEYVAFSAAMRELLPMRALLLEIGTKLKMKFITTSLVRSTVFEDNQGCLSLVNVPKMSMRNKYLALRYHFFRSHIGEDKGIVAKYIKTSEQKADIFTKGLPVDQFKVIRKLLIGW